jgi:hypothetical protein
VLALKGFRSLEEARPCLDEFAGLEAEALFFADTGLDLGVYLAAAARLRSARYCFLNSYSVPLVDGWLAKLDAALTPAGVGVAGASGAWISSRSWVAYSLGLPSAYRGLLPRPSVVRRALRATAPEQATDKAGPRLEALRARATTLRLLGEQQRFPAYALRTNAFTISHVTLRLLRLSSVKGRVDSLALESGRDSITQQLQQLGLRTVVVDRFGDAFDHECWDRSFTFWQGDQQGLLVADNRTRVYERADLELRRVLSSLTWGEQAEPAARTQETGTHLQ